MGLYVKPMKMNIEVNYRMQVVYKYCKTLLICEDFIFALIRQGIETRK